MRDCALSVLSGLIHLIIITAQQIRAIMIPIWKMLELRPREVERIAQSHTARKWQNWDSDPGRLISEATPLTTILPLDNKMRQALF